MPAAKTTAKKKTANTAKKVVATKTVKAANSNGGGRAKAFPTRELTTWLQKHKSWDHQDWLRLLEELNAKGYKDLVASPSGRESIGSYLESNRH